MSPLCFVLVLEGGSTRFSVLALYFSWLLYLMFGTYKKLRGFSFNWNWFNSWVRIVPSPSEHPSNLLCTEHLTSTMHLCIHWHYHMYCWNRFCFSHPPLIAGSRHRQCGTGAGWSRGLQFKDSEDKLKRAIWPKRKLFPNGQVRLKREIQSKRKV